MDASPIAAPFVLVVALAALALLELCFQPLVHLVGGARTAASFQKIEPGDGTKSIDDMSLFADRVFSRLGRGNEIFDGGLRYFNHLVKFSART